MHLIMIFSLLSIISLFAFSASRLLDAETQPIPVKVRKKRPLTFHNVRSYPKVFSETLKLSPLSDKILICSETN